MLRVLLLLLACTYLLKNELNLGSKSTHSRHAPSGGNPVVTGCGCSRISLLETKSRCPEPNKASALNKSHGKLMERICRSYKSWLCVPRVRKRSGLRWVLIDVWWHVTCSSLWLPEGIQHTYTRRLPGVTCEATVFCGSIAVRVGKSFSANIWFN